MYDLSLVGGHHYCHLQSMTIGTPDSSLHNIRQAIKIDQQTKLEFQWATINHFRLHDTNFQSRRQFILMPGPDP